MTQDDTKRPGAKGGSRTVDAIPFSDSLCHRCANSRVIATKTSKFLLCTVLAAKYPRQPVSDCAEFRLGERRQ